jgi:hypothetical protein
MMIHHYGIANPLLNMIAGQCTVGHFLIITQTKVARKCVEYALKLICEHLLVKKFSERYTRISLAGGGDPTHPHGRRSCARVFGTLGSAVTDGLAHC